MEFKTNEDESLNFIEKQFSTEPCINVITKEQFEERVSKVFNILWERLSMSFGPGGAGSFISIYPNYYNTKDGFTIMKNIAFDKKLDQVISDMVMTICSRLNFTVGDGTTTATIATKSAYDSYIKNRDYFKEKNILPRHILKRLDYYKNEILSNIDNMSTPIISDDPKELRKNIEKVVYISSNGNQELTTMIGSLYEELMYPAISVTLSQDGTMKSSIVSGYKLDICLTDKLYINNDNNTMILNGSDVIMFDHKVMKETYEKILKPLSEACKQRGRHLICIAPFYDENALGGVIKTDLNAEYRATQDINLVLMCCSKATGHARVLLEDLAMLLNTSIISPQTETDIISILNSEDNNIYNIFNIDDRKIDGLAIACVEDEETHRLSLTTYKEGINGFNITIPEKTINVGYCDSMDLGLKMSTFSGFYYDEATYNKYLSVAKEELSEIQKKCEKIGTFSVELNNKQQRVYALGLKNGLIEVGSTSEISQGYLKDTVDDAVKAAASAYNNGIVLGCNVTLVKAIDKILENDLDDIDRKLLIMLRDGYTEVYKTVLKNVFIDFMITDDNTDVFGLDLKPILAKYMECNNDEEKESHPEYKTIGGYLKKEIISSHDLIVWNSVNENKVLNLESMEFSSDVINSAETDKEILKATIDLLGLLITGNQLVLC